MYNSIRTLCAVACIVGLGGSASAAPAWQDTGRDASSATFQELPPIGYATPQQMALELRELAGESSHMSVQAIGKTHLGAALSMVTLSDGSMGQTRPEILIVANLEGDRPVASEVAMGLIRHLAAGESPLLEVARVHVLPMANPDGATHALAGGSPWRGGPVDEDRDGRTDEDGPTDLDGDGKLLWLRVPSAAGDWHASPTDPRCSVQAKHVREHAGAFHLRREGLDSDGDREFSEDGAGGIEVDANFAHRWKQYAPKAGPYPLSEPESRALVDFMISHPRIACVLVLDDEDNLSKTPKGSDKVKIDSTDPMEADAGLIAMLAKRLKPEKKSTKDSEPVEEPVEIGSSPILLDDEGNGIDPGQYEPVTTEENPKPEAANMPSRVAPRSADHGEGNFADWAYYQRGVFVLESAVWSPSLDSKDAEGKSLPKEATEEEKLLAWADAVYGGQAFKDWTPFVHNELGPIEIGGFLPLVLANPPATELPGLIEHYAGFVDSLAGDLARIEWGEVSYVALDDQGVFEIRAKLINRGRFASTPEMGRKNRVPLPIRVRLELPEGAQLLVGRLNSSEARLPGFGGSKDHHWIVRVPAGAGNPKLIAQSATAGQARLTLEVK